MGQTHKAQSAMLLVSLLTGCLTNGDRVLQPQDEGGPVASTTASRSNASEAAGGATANTMQPSQMRPATGGSTGKDVVAGSPSGQAGSGGDANNVSGGGSGGSAAELESAREAEPVGGGGSAAPETGGSSGMSGMAGETGALDAGSIATGGAADSECDFTGIWIAQQLTVSQALDLPQTCNNWYFLEFAQTGEDVLVSDHLDCGMEIRGSATVTVTRETVTALLRANSQRGRKGKVKRIEGTCELEMDRFWSVRGAEERFIPIDGRAALESIADVAKVQPLPTQDDTAGAIDPEGDGQLGVAFQASGILSGTRNSVQRDWTRWFTEPGYEIAVSDDWRDELNVRADFDNQEVVMHTTSSLLSTLSTPVATKHVLRLRFLGRSREDARAQAIIKSNDVDTCYAIQDALPATTLEVR